MSQSNSMTTAASSNYDFLLKALLVGDSGVGKSSILLRFTADEFDDQQLSTIGVDFKVKFIDVGGRRVKLFVWDTAGQERFRTLTSSYYRGAQGIVLVYDCTNRQSFESLTFWQQEVKKNCSNQDAIKLLVANKIDRGRPEVSREEGERFAMDHSMLFIETSAKTRFGIHQAFEELVMKILESPSLIQSNGGHRRLVSESFAEPPSSSCLC